MYSHLPQCIYIELLICFVIHAEADWRADASGRKYLMKCAHTYFHACLVHLGTGFCLSSGPVRWRGWLITVRMRCSLSGLPHLLTEYEPLTMIACAAGSHQHAYQGDLHLAPVWGTCARAVPANANCQSLHDPPAVHRNTGLNHSGLPGMQDWSCVNKCAKYACTHRSSSKHKHALPTSLPVSYTLLWFFTPWRCRVLLACYLESSSQASLPWSHACRS